MNWTQCRRWCAFLFVAVFALAGCDDPGITSFSAGASPIVMGASTTLTAVFANATGSVDQGVGTVASGTPYVVHPTSNTTYTLTIANGDGVTATKTVTVQVLQVVPPPAQPVITAPSSVTSGHPGYTASVAAQPGMTFAWTITNPGAAITAGADSNAITFTAGDAGPLTLGCTVTNAAGTSAHAQATVNVAPTLSFSAKGGKGLANDGGYGGYFEMDAYGADVKVLATGVVNTDVTLPTDLPYLGTNWVDVTTNTTLGVGSSGFHLTAGSDTVSNDSGPVTGIRVRPGATLTIQPNFDQDNADWDWDASTGTLEQVIITLSDGLVVEGTIKIAPKDLSAQGDGLGPDSADFRENNWTGGLFIASGGKLDLSGASNAAGPGGNGGNFYWRPESLNNAGTITTAGGAGSTSGGSGGNVEVYTTHGYAVSTGSVTSDGGAGGTGSGGGAGYINLESDWWDYGYLVAKGLFSATGGNGDAGGSGNSIHFYTNDGATIAAGTFRSYGGTSTGDASGGNGGYFYVESWGTVRVTGTIDTHGGNGAGSGSGGNGGYVELYAGSNYSQGSDSVEPDSQSVSLGANINANGGDGAYGGNAGFFNVYNDSNDATPAMSPMQLVGYSTIDLSGGDGHANGGSAGWGNYLETQVAYSNSGSYFAGSVTNEANFVMRGGKGETGSGGSGAGISMQTESDLYQPYNYGLTNSGSLDGSGGQGAVDGGYGGYFHLYGKYYLRNTGTISASGGNGGTGSGYTGNEIYLYSDVSLTSAGALYANGGNSDSGNGGRSGYIYINAANTATVTGSVAANGGNSTSANGGSGGYIWIMSQDAASQVSGSKSVSAGTGAGTPSSGEIWIDGLQVAGGRSHST